MRILLLLVSCSLMDKVLVGSGSVMGVLGVGLFWSLMKVMSLLVVWWMLV